MDRVLDALKTLSDDSARVLRLAKRWLRCLDSGTDLSQSNKRMYFTFYGELADRLFAFRNKWWVSPEAFEEADRKTVGLKDAVDYFEEAVFDLMKYVDMHTLKSYQLVEIFTPTIKKFGKAVGLLGELIDHMEAEERPDERPIWDQETRRLFFGGTPLREFSGRAKAQMEILAAFQRRGWPRSVPNPTRWSQKKLSDTLEHLNAGLPEGSPIRFEIRNRRPTWFSPARRSPRTSKTSP